MPRVEYQNVGRDSGLYEGIRLKKSLVFVESAWKMRCRIITLHLLLEEAICGTERDSLNGQRKRHV